jgi:hypothetical protein
MQLPATGTVVWFVFGVVPVEVLAFGGVTPVIIMLIHGTETREGFDDGS